MSNSQAEIVLRLFFARQPKHEDMVELDSMGRVRRIDIKPAKTDMNLTWMMAVWRPIFTQFLHEYKEAFVSTIQKDQELSSQQQISELFMGEVIQAAIESDMQIESVLFSEGNYIDIGNPENIIKAHQINWIR